MKRVIAVTLLLCAGLWCLAQAQEGRPVGPNPTAVGTAAVGQIPGTTTNDSASAGNVGEIIASLGGASNVTVTFTNGSAVIADADTCAANALTTCVGIGSAVNFTTSGSLPTNFTVGTTYYVSATGFTPGTSYEVATTPTGTPIVAGSAGSGTQTRNNATAGNSNASPITIAAVSLTAGQWSCSGNGVQHNFNSATTTVIEAFIGISNSSETGAVFESYNRLEDLVTTTSFVSLHSTGTIPLKLSSTTEYYLETKDSFSAGTDATTGALICTRTR